MNVKKIRPVHILKLILKHGRLQQERRKYHHLVERYDYFAQASFLPLFFLIS